MFRPVGRNLDIQLKSTTKAILTDDEVIHDLDARAYNILRHATHGAPLYLVLFVMPPDPAEWVAQDEERLELRHCAYWLSLRRARAVPNTRSVRVRIPRRNQFTPAALTRIMEALTHEEDV